VILILHLGKGGRGFTAIFHLDDVIAEIVLNRLFADSPTFMANGGFGKRLHHHVAREVTRSPPFLAEPVSFDFSVASLEIRTFLDCLRMSLASASVAQNVARAHFILGLYLPTGSA